MLLENELRIRKEEIEGYITSYLPKDDRYNKLVIDAMTYSLLAGGKRLRPILMQEAFNICNGSSKHIKGFMVAMEMIHTYSLIHDDLPAMDNDDLRRGKATCHVKYGENIAILAGDGLLNLAFEIILKESLEEPSTHILNAGNTIAKAAGVSGMIGGQVADVINEGKIMDMPLIHYIHMHKTAALIEASLIAGAYLAEAPIHMIECFEKIGKNIGLAFQIQDDILDIEGNEKELGKPLNSDSKNNKGTYVTIMGVAASKRKVNELLDEAITMAQSVEGKQNTFLVELIKYINARKK
jgi:geranylgeranyl diphosphate synthase type II